MNSYTIKEFLNLRIDGKSCLTVMPQDLNPLLKCLEIMGEPCLIEMKPVAERNTSSAYESIKEPIYCIYRKMTVSTKDSTGAYAEIPGIGLIKNPNYNGCGKLKCE
jgi:hypothetical protein